MAFKMRASVTSSGGSRRSLLAIVAVVCATVASGPLVAQTVPTSVSDTRGRKLAPDALNVIAPAVEYGETFQGPIDLPVVLNNPDIDWVPNYSEATDTLANLGSNVVFRGDVYCLEFAFKPVRMIEIALPTSQGIERKKVWYLLYRVRYLGGDYKPKSEEDQFNNEVFAVPQSVSAKWVRFLPLFELEVKSLNKSYLDQVIPAVKRSIAIKERVGKPIYNSVEIEKLKIDLSTPTANNEVWGVATWVDVDPRTDFFSVAVKGLTNAQKISQNGTEISYLQKTLVLNFSRPGDTIDELEDRIRYGIPAFSDPARQKYVLDQFGLQERLDHVWEYR